jgi:hypothetical protein
MRARAIAIAVVVAALGCASLAMAAASREDFVAKVDPICKAKQQQAEKILAKAGNSDFAQGKAWGTIAREDRDALSAIYKVGAAPADLVTFDRWVQKIQRENAIVVRMARSLKDGHPRKAKILLQKATDTDKRGEKVVRDFGFKYCSHSTVGTP